MTIQQLNYVIQIAESGSFNRAAEKLFVAQPSLTSSIQELEKEIGITISVGVSFCKVFAKMGSDYKKPDASTVISRENYRQLLWPLPWLRPHQIARIS